MGARQGSTARTGWLSRRRAAAVLAAVLLAAAAWYLGSPLFVRTTASEALPTAAPRTTVTAATSVDTVQVTSAPSAASPSVLAEGQLRFVDNIHNGKGPVRVLELGRQHILRFEDVAITNAPDVHVYLSRETGGKWSEGTSLYLGPLKATNGSFNYDIPASADLAAYKSVIVWCRAFSVLVTWADLTPPRG